MEDRKLPEYEAPSVITYTDEEILDELGPAQTGYVSDNAMSHQVKSKWISSFVGASGAVFIVLDPPQGYADGTA